MRNLMKKWLKTFNIVDVTVVVALNIATDVFSDIIFCKIC